MRIKSIDPKFAFFLDAGHGAVNPWTGKYVTAPSKMYKHDKAIFHNEGWFYEGVWNRQITNLIYQVCVQAGIPTFYIGDPIHDYRLDSRVQMINDLYKDYSKGWGLSNHANSSPNHNARGREFYTSTGATRSDTIALRMAIHANNEIPEFLNRGVKQKNFYILARTNCPMVLAEWGFFDEKNDATLLNSHTIQDRISYVVLYTVYWYLETYHLAEFEDLLN